MGVMNQRGDYSGFRRFENGPITEQTRIKTVADLSAQTTLRVDSDGDGKDVMVYNATSNSPTVLLNHRSIVLYGGSVLLAVIILLFARAPKKTFRQKSITERET